MHKRDLLKGLAAAAVSSLAGCNEAAPDRAGPFLSSRSAVFIPGYEPGDAALRGEPADSRLRRRRHEDGPRTLLTRIGGDGSVRQAVFPVIGHDVAIAPGGKLGILGRMGNGGGDAAAHHVAFDPDTLEMVAAGASPGAGWRGGGHGVYLTQSTVLCAERAPLIAYDGRPGAHHGRVSVREASSLRLLDSFSCHGIDPHEIRLSTDGKQAIIANYGSVAQVGTRALSVPRHVVEPSITVVDIASGRLVARHRADDPETEVRHVALAGDGTAFGIRCRLGAPGADLAWRREIGSADPDRTATENGSYLPAAPVMARRGQSGVQVLADDEPPAHLRHGLSVEYDPVHDEFIASFPSSHRLIVFSVDGTLRQSMDTRVFGLDYPCGVTLLPGRDVYAVAGYWRGVHVLRRGSHGHEGRIDHGAVLYGHSHMTAA